MALLALVQMLLRRALFRLDADIAELRKDNSDLRIEVGAIKLASARAEGIAVEHMKREEDYFWPKIDALHVRLDSFQREDISAHAVLGERLTRIETLVLNGRVKTT